MKELLRAALRVERLSVGAAPRGQNGARDRPATTTPTTSRPGCERPRRCRRTPAGGAREQRTRRDAFVERRVRRRQQHRRGAVEPGQALGERGRRGRVAQAHHQPPRRSAGVFMVITAS